MTVVFKCEKRDFEKLISNCPDEPVTPYIHKYFKKDELILEAGCGSGRFVYYLDKIGFNIRGIEIGHESVKK